MSTSSLGLPASGSPDVEGWTVFGWSRGYVAFLATTEIGSGSSTSTFDTAASADGMHWTVGKPIVSSAPDARITDVVEGPAGLLAYDSEALMCGSVPNTDRLIARSPDGIGWSPTGPTALDPVSIQSIQAGSKGYIATGGGGVFTSTDGAVWHKANLRGTAFKGLDEIENGAAFAAGYVIAGQTYGPMTEGCGAGRSLLLPSLWWSPDGAAWTRDTVPNVIVGTDVRMSVRRLGDRALIATAWNTATNASADWISTDGRTWARISVPDPSPAGPTIVSSGDRALLLVSSGEGPAKLYTMGTDGRSAELAQSGDVPDQAQVAGSPALGPTGLIFIYNDTTWIGVPAAS